MKKFGFTLSEMLITLLILGFIGALGVRGLLMAQEADMVKILEREETAVLLLITVQLLMENGISMLDILTGYINLNICNEHNSLVPV